MISRTGRLAQMWILITPSCIYTYPTFADAYQRARHYTCPTSIEQVF